jgi:hypothetical protein
VHERRLDPQVAHDGLVIEQIVLPRDIVGHPRRRRTLRYAQLDPTTQDVDARILFQDSSLLGQTCGQADVVGVHAGEKRGPRRVGGRGQGRYETAGRGMDHPQPGVAPRPLVEDFRAAVLGAVVDRHHLVIPQGLGGERGEAAGKGGGRVAHGKQDGDERMHASSL